MAEPKKRTNAEILKDIKDTEARIAKDTETRLAKDVVEATLARLRQENDALRESLRTNQGLAAAPAGVDSEKAPPVSKLDVAELRAANAELRAKIHGLHGEDADHEGTAEEASPASGKAPT